MVYFMVGLPHKLHHLKRAGLLTCRKVILVHLGKTPRKAGLGNFEDTDINMLDSAAVTISNKIYQAYREAGINNHPIVEVLSNSTIPFLSPDFCTFSPRHERRVFVDEKAKKKSVPRLIDPMLMPMYASGSALSPAMVESVLLNAYQNPSILNLFNCIAGIRLRLDIELDTLLKQKEPGYVIMISLFNEVDISHPSRCLENILAIPIPTSLEH
jgi:hypothetical protein